METCLSGLRYLFAKEAGALNPLAGSNPAVSAILRIFHFRKRLPRGFAARQARKARQSQILRGFATLRVAKRKRLDFGFGSSNQSFLENPESLRDFLWNR